MFLKKKTNIKMHFVSALLLSLFLSAFSRSVLFRTLEENMEVGKLDHTRRRAAGCVWECVQAV